MKLNSLTVGTGSREVVFLHGLFGQGKNFGTIAAPLGDLATCHLLDLPNHGLSPWTTTYDLDEQADIVADWIAETIVMPVTLIGHSLGGKIAMRLALRRPELVDRLMVVDISPARNDVALNFTGLVSALRSLPIDDLTSRTEAEAMLLEKIPDKAVRQFLLQNLRHKGSTWFWAANLDLLGDSLYEIGGWPALTSEYDGPVLWVAGARSPYIRPEHIEPMRELFPRMRMITLKRAGHWVHADEPEAFVTLCRAFFEAQG